MRDTYMQKPKRSRKRAGLPFGLEQDLGQNLSALGKLCYLNLPQILAVHWDMLNSIVTDIALVPLPQLTHLWFSEPDVFVLTLWKNENIRIQKK